MSSSRTNNWTLGIVSTALFMVVLDNLVVSIALPSIHRDLGASIQSLEWTVNAYVLAYAVLLLTGAALGDRFGRKRMFLAGLSLFTAASAAAALAPSTELLVAARAVQGMGAAMVTPLTLTLLAEAFPADRGSEGSPIGLHRGMALGVWSGVSGSAVALGPLVGGAVVQSISWHWIFWINVPIGLVLLPLAAARLRESHGPNGALDLRGLALASAGAFGIVFGIVRAQSLGWTSTTILASLSAGAVLLALFVAWERRAREPMLPMSFFTRRAFAVTNFASLTMYFGMFGSIFFLSQFMQDVLGNSPLEAGLKILVWTGATMVVAPFAGVFSQRFGSRPFMLSGLALQAGALAWLASILSTHTPYGEMIVPFIMAGAGMALVFAPSANAVLSAVRADQAGQASGATNAIRETGGVLGVAVLATIFTHVGGYGSPQAFVNGLEPALWVAVAMLGAGTLAVLALPFSTKAPAVTPAADGAAIPEADGQRRPARGVKLPAGAVGEAA
ncbi:MAG TPA: DHA2 family efflux MFS transporter permease subunit [Solirubrobacteraceae bacterium]|jgi:EmrB/QacA subfamily drug resistance transporter|nr:DHA2 family efflux MFS transporter permease subunit [Solirubrobacteraceae bacterium]